MGLKLLFLFILLAAAMAATVEAQYLEGCRKECGGVEIPYPFGVGKQNGSGPNCFLEDSLELTCNTSTRPPKLLYGSLPVHNISAQDGLMDISFAVSKFCYNYFEDPPDVLDAGNFTISSSQNMFISVGCNTQGMIAGVQKMHTYNNYGGCLAICDELPTDDTCSGTGCCQAEIPADGMRRIVVRAIRAFEHYEGPTGNNSCLYAFVAKKDWFHFSHDFVQKLPFETTRVVLNWTVSNSTCQKGSTNCACKNKADRVDYDNGLRYKCRCKAGYEGNPYYDGCHDVDECKTHHDCSRPERCHNLLGGYSCSCPPLYKGDGYKSGTSCTLDSELIALGSSVALLVVFTLVSTSCWAYKQRAWKQLRRRNFEHNGGNILQQRLSEQEGYSDKTKIFTEVELKNATNNFDESRILGHGGQGIVYKGILPDNTVVAIKKSRVGGDPRQIKDFINEVIVLSQINHRSVVKLLGCCLETEIPLLVYEFVDNGTLLDHIEPSKNECSITWETRLRIAAETAEAISYLHTSASIPVIHRDIKSANILLDHNLRAKVSDFGASRLIPLDETHVTTIVQGTLGYLDPEYLHIGELNEKSDVYSFGVVLVELITGNKAVDFNRLEQRNLAMYFVSSVEGNCLWEILDRRVLERKNAEQLKEVALLARRCVRVKGEERPTMKEVAMELEGLISIGKHPWGKDEDIEEETEYLLGHVPDGYEGASASSLVPGYDSVQNQAAFEIADGR